MIHHTDNTKILAEFYALQRDFADALGRLPHVVSDWLRSRPAPQRSTQDAGTASAGWRTARLNGHRHRELAERIARSDPDLGAWLLKSLPLSSLFEIAACARPSLGAWDREAADAGCRLVSLRETLFYANYGLARVAASPGRPVDFDQRLSAASSGLLDALDRYVPGEGAATFAYFATYWIRYHIARCVHRGSTVITFPVHYREERPAVLSLQAPQDSRDDTGESWEPLLRDPEPEPGAGGDGVEVTRRIRTWIRSTLPPGTRVMLAFAFSVGPLNEAATDYVAHLGDVARERLR